MEPPRTQKYYSASLKTVATGSTIALEICFTSLLDAGRYSIRRQKKQGWKKKKKKVWRKGERKQEKNQPRCTTYYLL